MNRNKFALAVALFIGTAAAGSAFADDIAIDSTPFTSTKSRAEVQAELRKPGANPWSTQYNPLATFKSSVTRAQVRAEYISARHEVAALNGEGSGSAYLLPTNTSTVDSTRVAGQPLNAQ